MSVFFNREDEIMEYAIIFAPDLEKMMNYDTSGRSDDAFQLHQYEIT